MRRPFLATAAALLAALPAAAAPAAAAGPTVAVGDSPTAVPGVRALGAAPADATVQLDVVLSPRDPEALSAFVDAVSTPGSPRYGDYLATGEFRGRFGPTDAAIAEVRTALVDAGLRPGPTSRSGLSIPVTTTVAAAEAAFGTPIERYRRADGGIAIAAERAPRVPAAIAPQVAAVVGLDTRSRPQPSGRGRVAESTGSMAGSSGARAAGTPVAPALAPGSTPPQACALFADVAERYGVYTMNEIAGAYDLDGVFAAGNGGAGATVALVEFEPYTPSDIEAFQDCYGTDTRITDVDVNGGPSGPQVGEAALDIEILTALVPEAEILVYQGPNDGSTDVYQQIADDNLAQVVSSSWGECEPFMDQNAVLAESLIFQQMAAQGQTILAAAGDYGSTDCYNPIDNPTQTELAVNDPASQPTVTGVGGTRLVEATDPPVEHVWNDGATTRDGAGGGGQSSFWPMPTYQSGPGVIGPDSGSAQACAFAEAYCRQVPDVSALGDPDTGYVIVHGGEWRINGGTSAATPVWAATTALITRSPGCEATGRVGFLNPALYQFARTSLGAFNDITVGDNDFLGLNRGLFPAGPGYDMASGLGSPVASRLQLGLCGGIAAPAFTSAANAAFTVGQPGSFAVTTRGAPTPALTVTSGLPAGLSFTDNGNGTATVSGTPGAGSAGTYTVQLGAANGLEPNGSQALTVTVAPAPVPPAPPAPPAAPNVPAPPAGLPQANARTRVLVAAVTPRSFALSRSGRVSIPLACPRVVGGCRVGATLTPAARGRRAVAPVVLARGTAVRIAPGARRTITLRLTRRGRRAVAASSRSLRLRTRLALTSSFGGGQRTTSRSALVLRLPARGLR